ncbi:hypothetical protein PSU4_33960 [Pseudonocardia sulfidoxydans NBRC 16205]|uniref:Uncharacterized protein n=1 Tax=Pseudonocardia sulfidoxydans NBRC 16205 TaxID=1223511 RepID=A0A511DI11_9PSEU|nr:hypothetical protein [Pseudonocardia sulfidoxydans]GEL24442.1 hypothetical protein PSU4_33960 [Pseudonocardia sulfidoxydans NBRC 16205]
MAGTSPLWVGLTIYALVTLAPTLIFWAALRVPSVLAARRRRSVGVPSRPPIEDLVADLRRLRRNLRAGGSGSRVRRVALQSAYDDVLLEVCEAVGVDTARLAATPEQGSERAFARLVAEADLESSGIELDQAGGGRAAA